MSTGSVSEFGPRGFSNSEQGVHPTRGPLRKTLKSPLDRALPQASRFAAHGRERAGPVCPPARHSRHPTRKRPQLTGCPRRPPPNALGPGTGTQSDGTGTFLERGSSEPRAAVTRRGRQTFAVLPRTGRLRPGPDAGDRVWHNQQGAGAGTSGAEATSKVARGVTAATAGLPVAQRAEAQA